MDTNQASAGHQTDAVCLTAREQHVLNALAAGLSNKEIGSALAISPRTVQKHLEHIYQKLGVENRTRAVVHLLAVAGLHYRHRKQTEGANGDLHAAVGSHRGV